MAARTATSQRDIAARAGVSQATVSIVLNGRAEAMGIPPKTQERIKRVIEELQYVPNVAARALRGGRNNLIGVYTYERVFPLSPSDYYNEFLHGIEEGAVSLGLDLVLFTSSLASEDGSGGVYAGGANRLGIADGTVMLGSKKSDEELARLSAEGYPFVFIGRREVPGVLVPCVTADYYSAMASVVELLASFGHQRVLYVGQAARTQPHDERLKGFADFAQAQPGFLTSSVLMDADDIDAGCVQTWIREGSTAIVAETASVATAVLAACESSNIVVPDQLSLIALDVGVMLGGAEVSHLGIPRRSLGWEAVALLAQLIQSGEAPNPTVILDCSPPSPATVAAPAT